MAGSVSIENSSPRPPKIPKLQKACEESRSNSSWRELRWSDVGDDEYLRQYMLYYYQCEKTEGFTIDWEQFDYVFHVQSLDDSPPISQTKSNAELIRDVTLSAIDKHNQDKGTQLAFVEHVSANYTFVNGLLAWLTFWARDMSEPNQDSKIYQAKVWRRGKIFKIIVFRLKPTDQEIASVQVDPPCPRDYEDDLDKPPVVFARAASQDGVPFVFSRNEGRTWS